MARLAWSDCMRSQRRGLETLAFVGDRLELSLIVYCRFFFLLFDAVVGFRYVNSAMVELNRNGGEMLL
jgi:hypothetical protein